MKTRMLLSVMLLAAAIPVAGSAQDGTPSLQRGPNVDYLTDGAGNSVYIYLRDGGQGMSSCYDRCAENWPPVLVDGTPVLGDGLVNSLVSTVQRTDGTTQLAYDGWPLYHYARDVEPGQAYGHTLGDTFYLVSSSGARVARGVEDQIAAGFSEDGEDVAEAGSAAPAAPAPEAEEDATAVASVGGDVYAANCAVCHGANGEGVVGPGLAGNPVVARADYVIQTILFGREDHGMPAFESRLADEDVAAIATYVRGSWGNDYAAVTPAEVGALR